jgi:hypothetical protein
MTTSNPTLTWSAPTVRENCRYVYGSDVSDADALIHTETCWRSAVVSHGLKDSKGREIGNFASIEARPKRARDAAGKTLGLEAHETFFVSTQATRDGRSFGASCGKQGTECFSLDEAKALAAKKIAEAGKRFARAVAKGEGKQFAAKVSS